MATLSSNPRRVLVAAPFASTACMRGITRFARENNWHLVMDIMYMGMLPDHWRADGVLALGHCPLEWLEKVRLSRLPIVALSESDIPHGLLRLDFDHTEIARMAAEHFLSRSHRHFAWAPFIDDQANRNRLSAFRSRLSDDDCDCYELPPAFAHVGAVYQDNWSENRRSFLLELQRLPRPTAIFAFNDGVAANLVDACREAGLNVPEDVAILGAGDSLSCETSSIPLSSIDLDFENASYQAASMLDHAMRAKRPLHESKPVRPKGVITRISSDFTAVTNPRVARALTFIAEHYTNPLLSVNDVACAVGTSRRNLERSFRAETGFTIHEQISRSRMQEASRLLKTHARVRTAEVAALVGLAGSGTFSRTFRRYYGTSPQAHRAWSTRAERTQSPALHPTVSINASKLPVDRRRAS